MVLALSLAVFLVFSLIFINVLVQLAHIHVEQEGINQLIMKIVTIITWQLTMDALIVLLTQAILAQTLLGLLQLVLKLVEMEQ